MAEEEVDGRTGTSKLGAAHFRMDEAMREKIDGLIDPRIPGLESRSSVIRLLLSAALNDDLKVAAVREAVFEVANRRRKLVGRLVKAANVAITEALEEALGAGDRG